MLHKSLFKLVFCMIMLILGLGVTTAVSADESKISNSPETRSKETEAVQSEVDKEVDDKKTEHLKKVVENAVIAVKEAEKALKALEEDNKDEALAALEVSTGKLEIVLARAPELSLAPVHFDVLTHDMYAGPDTIKRVIKRASDFLEAGEIQKSRRLISRLGSEIVHRYTNLPLATFPEAIKKIIPLIDQGKIEEAKISLRAVLRTLVVTEEVIPLPKIRAERLLKKAEEMIENRKVAVKDNKVLSDLLKDARNQLEIAEILGYGTKKSYKDIYEQIDEIETKVEIGKGGKGWFVKIKRQISELL